MFQHPYIEPDGPDCFWVHLAGHSYLVRVHIAEGGYSESICECFADGAQESWGRSGIDFRTVEHALRSAITMIRMVLSHQSLKANEGEGA